MLDRSLRPLKDRLLEPAAGLLARRVRATALTGLSLTVTLVAAGFAAAGWYWVGLAAWLAGRVLDGLDGLVARRRGDASDLGGYLDMLADTIGYAAVPIGVAYGVDEPNTWIAVAFLLGSFYVNTISWAYLSAVLEKRGAGATATGEPTSVTMPPALVEGAETIVFFCIFLAVPALATWWFTVMAAMVAVNVLQRLTWANGGLG